MKFQNPGVAIALHRLEVLATVAAVAAVATLGQVPVIPSEAVLWQGLGPAE